MKVVLDAGVFVAVEKRDRRVGAMLRELHRRSVPLCTSSAVVAQVWRDGRKQAWLARFLAGVEVRGLAPGEDRRTGELLGRARTDDVVDAHLATLVDDGDRLLTSDPEDLGRLLAARGVDAALITC